MNIGSRLGKAVGVRMLLLALLIGPVGVTAQEDTLAELRALQEQIDVTEEVLAETYTLTTAQRNAFAALVSQIKNEITLQTALIMNDVTMEVVIEPGPVATAQVITANRVVNLDFSFNDSFATATPETILSDVVARTAFTLQLNEQTLGSGAVIVPSFSGIAVPESVLSQSTSPSPAGPPMQAADTIPEVQGRSNIESIRIGGSVPDYTIAAEVVYGPEPDFQRATITKLYTFIRPSSANSLFAALQDLVAQGSEKISADFGVTAAYLDAQAVVSIERYENSVSVPTVTQSTDVSSTDVFETLAISPISYFGFYSVIEEVRVSTNDVAEAGQGNSFSVFIESDQNETMQFSLSPEYELYSDGGDNDGSYLPTGQWEYSFLYSIHGVPVEEVTEDGVTFQSFTNYLDQYFAGVGDLYALSDQEFIPELAEFLADNSSAYEIQARDAADVEGTVVEAEACYQDREKDITTGVVAYMLEGMQSTEDWSDITYVYPNIDLTIDSSLPPSAVYRSCDVTNGFYPSVQ